MLFLSTREAAEWRQLADKAVERPVRPEELEDTVRPNLQAAFRFHVGAVLANRDQGRRGKEWLAAGTKCEEDGLFLNAFLMGFLERHQDRLMMPEVIFADPRPWVHFSTVPAMKQSRENLLRFAGHSLPAFDRPIRFMDIGCGDGALGAAMVDRLIKLGKVRDVAEICLVDSSQGMLDLAKETVGKVFPAKVIRTVHSKIQAFTDQIDRRYDVALASLAYHHMPMETKLVHMEKLRRWVDHYLLFEIDANNDTPEHLSPQLSLAVYQCYGRITDFVFAHDAPVEVAVSCVDRFLMSEAVSFLTQRRGERTDYHMLRSQWHDLFARGLGPDFSCWADANCYSDEFFELMYLHYGRR